MTTINQKSKNIVKYLICLENKDPLKIGKQGGTNKYRKDAYLNKL